MKTLKYIFPLLLLSIICTITISTQAQTLYWQKLTTDYYVYDILYDGQNNLYFSGSSGGYYFWRSTDLGQTWTKLGNGNLRLYRIALDSSGVLWGGNGSEGGIYKSTDQGETWTNNLPTNERIFSITVSPNNWIWAGTYDGEVVFSSDGGNTWGKDSLTNDIIWSIATNDSNHVFAGSMNSRIYRTTDLGITWGLVCTTTLGIWDIVIDNQNIIYVTAWGKRLISTDNGNTWTSISGPQLESLFIDKYHRIYAGPSGQRSLDNCSTWTRIGPVGSFYVQAYAFIDSLIFAATTKGIYLHDPSIEPYIGDNYFPLAIGNKWQFNRQCANYGSEQNSVYYVERDSVIMGKNYYLLKGSINDWLRYDSDVHKLFLRVNNHDYLVMDYTLNAGSSISFVTFNTHTIFDATITQPAIISIFDSSYYSKGKSWIGTGGMSGYTEYYSESLGTTKSTSDYSGPGGTWDYCLTKMIRAILYDSTGVRYYSDHVKPTINFQPVFVTNEFDLDWNFSVDHEYTYFENNGNENFVDSVLVYSYYSNDDSTFINQPVLAINTPNSINYSISYLLDSTLLKNNYSFYYKIYAVDKGIVPEHSTKPDSGFYELIYDPTVSVEIIENKVIYYDLKQNYPNPFNPVTVIEYTVKEEGNVELVIYDVLGKVVEKLIDERKIAGNYSTQFDASNLSSGIYFYTLRVNDFVNTKKMLLLK